MHFILCTEHPERHSRDTLHCPECGNHDGDFVTWTETVEGEIFLIVPGHAVPTQGVAVAGVSKVAIASIVPPIDDPDVQ